MKLITAYVHHIRAAHVVQALANAGFHNLALLDVRGTLKPIGGEERDYSTEGAGLVIGEFRLEVVCEESEVDAVTNIVRTEGRIGTHVSGWLYVSPIDQALPIGGSV